MKTNVKVIMLLFVLVFSTIILSSCSFNTSSTKPIITKEPISTKMVTTATAAPTKKPTSSSSLSSKTSSSSSRSSFTNKYGTPTTKCAHSGCNNYIASSGDTNCCTTHSKRCAECGKYIDEDAFYCMDCIKKALGK